MLARGKGQPDRVIQDILVTLNQEKEKHDIIGLYEGRLRSHTEDFEVRVSQHAAFDFDFHV
jgi:hypothetical protein